MAPGQRDSLPSFHKIRCSCANCGAHVIAYTGVGRLSGSCGTCGGRELTPLARVDRLAGASRPGLAV